MDEILVQIKCKCQLAEFGIHKEIHLFFFIPKVLNTNIDSKRILQVQAGLASGHMKIAMCKSIQRILNIVRQIFVEN